jgi:hypothetical protein
MKYNQYQKSEKIIGAFCKLYVRISRWEKGFTKAKGGAFLQPNATGKRNAKNVINSFLNLEML